MDFLQLALVFVILVLVGMLSVLGMQVFFILKDLRKSLDKIDLLLNEAQVVPDDMEKPVRAAVETTQTMEGGVKTVRPAAKVVKPGKRLFIKRR